MVSSKGTILRNDVSGSIMVKCYLSGTPECKVRTRTPPLLHPYNHHHHPYNRHHHTLP